MNEKGREKDAASALRFELDRCVWRYSSGEVDKLVVSDSLRSSLRRSGLELGGVVPLVDNSLIGAPVDDVEEWGPLIMF